MKRCFLTNVVYLSSLFRGETDKRRCFNRFFAAFSPTVHRLTASSTEQVIVDYFNMGNAKRLLRSVSRVELAALSIAGMH